MSTKYPILTTKKVTIFGDVFEEDTIFLRGENLSKVSFHTENGKTTVQVAIDIEEFLNICKNYIKHIEKNE
tara:strand:- start:154 stop:366 length:213 start_codon:yes stop_codon:yes gene_type:complete